MFELVPITNLDQPYLPPNNNIRLITLYFLPQPKAPVVTRACYMLECAYFVHQCNRGHWPSWMKAQLPAGTRPSRGTSLALSQPLVQRRLILMQLQASKMFHQWAEVRLASCRQNDDAKAALVNKGRRTYEEVRPFSHCALEIGKIVQYKFYVLE